MNVVTWNVNGVRARAGQVVELFTTEAPEVVCLQELKALPAEIPEPLATLPGYWSLWHGTTGGYSGVSLHLKHTFFPDPPRFSHPPFDVDARMVVAEVADLTLSSIYVPNGNRDYGEKVRFLEALTGWVADQVAAGRQLLLCGDLNVARLEMDVHPKLRNPRQIGQTAEERAMFEALLGHGLTDLSRVFFPDDERLFSWWAPWRNQRERNIGWRLDYHLVTVGLARAATHVEHRRTHGTSDHGPVAARYQLEPFTSTGAAPKPPPPRTGQLGFEFSQGTR